MRHAWIIHALACAILVCTNAARSAPPLPEPPSLPAPPALPERDAVALQIGALQEEMTRLASREDLAARARYAFRRAAFDMLLHGGPAREQALAIAGFRMADARHEFDRLVDEQAGGETQIDPTLREALQAFVAGCGNGLHPLPDPATPEVTLRVQLEPLRRAAAWLEAQGTSPFGATGRWPQPPDAWPTRAQMSSAAKPTAPDRDTPAASAPSTEPPSAASFDLDSIPSFLRPAARQIQQQAARGTPAQQAEALGDLQRLAAAGTWPERMDAVRAGTREPFERLLRQWGSTLAQTGASSRAQRQTVRTIMDTFADQLTQFHPVPLETRLRARDPAAIAAAAGQSQPLLEEIDRRRAAWALAWSRGRPAGMDATARAMQRVADTMEGLAAVAALEGTDPAETRLHRWGGFSARAVSTGLHPQALVARTRLTVEALLAGQDAEVDAQVDHLRRDLPVAWLVARLTEELQPWLEARGGVCAQLDAVCSGPGPESLLGTERATLMLFSRYLREEVAARQAHDEERARALRSYLADLARELMTPLEKPPAR